MILNCGGATIQREVQYISLYLGVSVFSLFFLLLVLLLVHLRLDRQTVAIGLKGQ